MARVVFSMTAKESQQEVKVFQKKFRQPALRSLCVKRMCLFISLSRPPSSSSSSSWSISCLLKATSSSTNFIKSKRVGSWKTNSLFWVFFCHGGKELLWLRLTSLLRSWSCLVCVSGFLCGAPLTHAISKDKPNAARSICTWEPSISTRDGELMRAGRRRRLLK